MPDKNRIGQQIKINHNPDIVYEITGWNEESGLWDAKCIEPSNKLVPIQYREDFMQYLEETGGLHTKGQ